jgi:hypothetical protein
VRLSLAALRQGLGAIAAKLNSHPLNSAQHRSIMIRSIECNFPQS